jgi:hypothetical protein
VLIDVRLPKPFWDQPKHPNVTRDRYENIPCLETCASALSTSRRLYVLDGIQAKTVVVPREIAHRTKMAPSPE